MDKTKSMIISKNEEKITTKMTVESRIIYILAIKIHKTRKNNAKQILENVLSIFYRFRNPIILKQKILKKTKMMTENLLILFHGITSCILSEIINSERQVIQIKYL